MNPNDITSEIDMATGKDSSVTLHVLDLPKDKCCVEFFFSKFQDVMNNSQQVHCDAYDVPSFEVGRKTMDFSTGEDKGLNSTWYILLYPHIRMKQKVHVDMLNTVSHVTDEDYVGLRLYCDSMNQNILSVAGVISLIGSDRASDIQSLEMDYARRDDFWNYSRDWKAFISHKTLISHAESLLRNDTLNIRCQLNIVYFYRSQEMPTSSTSHPTLTESDHSRLATAFDISNLLTTGMYSDIVLRCDNGVHIPAHRAIIACRCPVFFNLHQCPPGGYRTIDLRIPDIDSKVLMEVLRYIYGFGQIDIDSTICIDLYAAAVRYVLPELKRSCRNILEVSLDESNVCDVAVLAHIHKDSLLLEAVKKFVKSHLCQLMASKNWAAIIQAHQDLANILTNP